MIYLLLFVITALSSFSGNIKSNYFKYFWNLNFLIYIFIISLSYKLGVDSKLYNSAYLKLMELSFYDLFQDKFNNEFIYYLFCWIAIKLNFDFVVIQFLLTSIFPRCIY